MHGTLAWDIYRLHFNFKILVISSLPKEFDKLVEESIQEGYLFVQKTKIEWQKGVNSFSRPGEIFLLTKIVRKIIGCCRVNIDPYANDPGIGRIRHLYVSPSFRRQGIARSLVERCISNSRSTSSIIRLRASQLNEDANHFYEGIGFTPVKDSEYETHRLDLVLTCRTAKI
jgi:ribosomal protein S18 acetylase RimI-like enzyme